MLESESDSLSLSLSRSLGLTCTLSVFVFIAFHWQILLLNPSAVLFFRSCSPPCFLPLSVGYSYPFSLPSSRTLSARLLLYYWSVVKTAECVSACVSALMCSDSTMWSVCDPDCPVQGLNNIRLCLTVSTTPALLDYIRCNRVSCPELKDLKDVKLVFPTPHCTYRLIRL